MNTKRIHYISGLIITAFIALHLFNHLVSVFGIDWHITLMSFLRRFYRNPFAETVLLLAVAIQIYSGFKLFKIKRLVANTFFEKLQAWTGLYLAVFFIIHLGAIFVGRLFLHLDTNFYFGVAGLNTFPFNLFFIPYYSLAIISFCGHIAAIHNQKMKSTILGMAPGTQSKLILGFGIILTFVIVYGLTNHFQGVKIPEAYNVLIGK